MSARFNLCAYTHYKAAARFTTEENAQAIGYALAVLYAVRKRAKAFRVRKNDATETALDTAPFVARDTAPDAARGVAHEAQDGALILTVGGETVRVKDGRAVVLFKGAESRIVGTAQKFQTCVLPYLPPRLKQQVDEIIDSAPQEVLKTSAVFTIYKQVRDMNML